jgi:hypothetical protein
MWAKKQRKLWISFQSLISTIHNEFRTNLVQGNSTYLIGPIPMSALRTIGMI